MSSRLNACSKQDGLQQSQKLNISFLHRPFWCGAALVQLWKLRKSFVLE
jgi:hypothetical protein